MAAHPLNFRVFYSEKFSAQKGIEDSRRRFERLVPIPFKRRNKMAAHPLKHLKKAGRYRGTP
jgi:hypothetical protein